jgi:hypothetical protein
LTQACKLSFQIVVRHVFFPIRLGTSSCCQLYHAPGATELTWRPFMRFTAMDHPWI